MSRNAWDFRWIAGVVGLSWLAVAPLAAHAGPVEQFVQIAMHPTKPDVMSVRYSYGGDGILRTTDGGKSWQLMCASLLLDQQTHAGTIAIANDDTTFMGVFSGLWRDDKLACHWSREAQYEGEWLGDLAQHPTDPDVLFAITSTASSDTKKSVNGVLRRDASGKWSDFGTKEELLATRLHVVPRGSGLRLYVGAIKGTLMSSDGGLSLPNYVTRVSDDDGKTWQDFPFGATDGTLRLQGVDPNNPDRLVASVNRTRSSDSSAPDSGDDSVLVSNDKGAHFVEYLKLAEIGGVAFAPDGRIWIGDLGDSAQIKDKPGALWFAKNLDEAPQKLPMGNYPVQCLGYQKANDTLYACQHFWFGTVAKDGSFDSLLKFTEVKDFVECPDVATTCQPQMCSAWCGYGHFAVAPVCQVYTDMPSCGAEVAKAENESTGGSGGVGGNASGTGGVPVSMGGSGTGGSVSGSAGSAGSGTSARDAGVSATAGKTATNPPPKKKSTGCSAAFADGNATSNAWPALFLAAVGLWRRRRC